jgi:two-component system, chemotaxis family, CheB/CheR fusion protein
MRNTVEKKEENLASEDFTLLFPLLLKSSGIDFRMYKYPTLQRAIQKRMQALRFKTISQYTNYVKKNHKEAEDLTKSLLIKVTDFYRDSEVFLGLKNKIYPHLKANQPIRIWVPGCCTGEEVYSHAMSLLEYFKGKNISLQIFGTDLCEDSLKKARSGHYSKKEVAGLNRLFLQKYFNETNSHYEVHKNIRSMCTFAKQNLVQDPPFSKLDLISCRNVLIYLKPDLQEKAIQIFHYALHPHGFLLLGKSESIEVLQPALFSLVDKKLSIYEKKSSRGQRLLSFRYPPPAVKTPSDNFKNTTQIPFDFDMSKEIDRVLIERTGQAAVLVNDAHDIVQTRGNVSAYFRIPTGKMSSNVIKMINEDLAIELKLILQKVQKSGGAGSKSIEVGHHKITLEVLPLYKTLLKEKYFLILLSLDKSTSPVSFTKPATVTDNKKIMHLQRELNSDKVWIQNILEEHENTIQELKSTHEEVLSSNEELQSLNEELQTAKEELESTNEELTTVNEQIQNQNEELRQSEERFRILVESVQDYAIFMLDPKGYVMTWNKGAQKIKGYQANEIIGSHFSRFYPAEDQKKPAIELREAKRTGVYKEEGRRVRKDGSQFWARVVITALKDKEDKLRGFAKVTFDMTEKKIAEEKLQQSEKKLRKNNEELEERVKARTQELQRYAEELTRSNADLQQFAYIASHDLQEPLRIVSLYADLLGRQLKDTAGPKAMEYFQFLHEGAVRAQRLIRELLEYSRIDAKNDPFIDVPLDNIINHVLSLLDITIKETKTRVTYGAMPSLPVDRFQIEQLFQNLISNAIKYKSKENPYIHISARRERNMWTISVKDNGIGIDPQYHQHIFTIFKRLHSSKDYPGTGIGLAFCKKIVEHHGGTIRVESSPKKGSTFIFTLPDKRKSSDDSNH